MNYSYDGVFLPVRLLIFKHCILLSEMLQVGLLKVLISLQYLGNICTFSHLLQPNLGLLQKSLGLNLCFVLSPMHSDSVVWEFDHFTDQAPIPSKSQMFSSR